MVAVGVRKNIGKYMLRTSNSVPALLVLLNLIIVSILPATPITDKPFQDWTLQEAIRILTESPWAQKETFTRIIGGIGSGVRGEKEIYNTFFVRFLSARPIREGYARVKQLEHSYDQLSPEEKNRVDMSLRPVLELNVESWIVVAVSFRSNDPDLESRVRQFWRDQTAGTLQNQTFLSSEHFPQIQLAAYYPPLEEGIGAKFVFPKDINGVPVVLAEDKTVTFELLDIPGANPHLRVAFEVAEMTKKGQLAL